MPYNGAYVGDASVVSVKTQRTVNSTSSYCTNVKRQNTVLSKTYYLIVNLRIIKIRVFKR
jgi:hypothetical protein